MREGSRGQTHRTHTDVTSSFPTPTLENAASGAEVGETYGAAAEEARKARRPAATWLSTA